MQPEAVDLVSIGADHQNRDCQLKPEAARAWRALQDAAMAEVFGTYNVVGFNTYGEQFCGVHVNQTLTGIAIGQGAVHG